MAGPFGHSSRNFGYGKNLDYACREALRQHYGGGHFSSRHSHRTRFHQAVEFWRSEGIRDARLIDQAAVDRYAAHVAELHCDEAIVTSTAQNRLSTVNVVLGILRGNSCLKISPSHWVGKRTNVRTMPPGGMNRAIVEACAANLRTLGYDRAAATVELARDLGVRMREAALADLARLAKEADERGTVNIQEGTKGGRNAPRWVPVSPALRLTLARAMAARPEGSSNLIAKTATWAQLRDGELKAARAILHKYTIKGYHELRAAYACNRYTVLTGHAPPALGGTIPDRERDLLARQTLAVELGHERTDVLNSYIGGRQ